MAEPASNPDRGERPPRRGVPASPSERTRHAERAQRRMLLAVRLLYMVLLVTVALLPFVGSVTSDAEFTFADYAGAFSATFLFGAGVLFIDAITPNKKLASVFGIYLGIIAGLVGALAIGALLDLIAQSWDLKTNPWLGDRGLVKLAIGITLCYLAVSIVLTTKDDFRLVIPYVEFAKQVRGVRPLLLDTSALIDGRIDGVSQSGFLDAPLVVPQFVVDELQTLADSSDRLKRARGRRGLDMVNSLQSNALVDVSIDPAEAGGHSVDHMLLRMAGEQNLRILTTDYNLIKVARIQGVTVLNLNDLANTLRPQVVAGDRLEIEISKRGESAEQGVGYLPEGTMVVVENASDLIGQSVPVVVTNALQTSAGRMVFGKLAQSETNGPAAGGDDEAHRVENLAEAATRQPRTTTRPAPTEGRSRRNPRR
jgi:uncharacterized protein YacL